MTKVSTAAPVVQTTARQQFIEYEQLRVAAATSAASIRRALATPLEAGRGLLIQVGEGVDLKRLRADLLAWARRGAPQALAFTLSAAALLACGTLGAELASLGFVVGFFEDGQLVAAMTHAMREAKLAELEPQA